MLKFYKRKETEGQRFSAGLSRLGGSIQPPVIQRPHPVKSNPVPAFLHLKWFV
jgi:hypothetical protein